jgi:flagellar basal-body rod protein FlgF
MGDFIDSAARILAQSQSRVEVSAQNIANGTTPGYKRRLSFSDVIQMEQSIGGTLQRESLKTDVTPGKIIQTDVLTDLALLGGGLFVVRGEGGTFFTRQGQFSRDTGGRLVGPGGMALQLEGGGDLQIKSAAFSVTADGTVLEDGEPTGRLAIVSVDAAELVDGPAGGLFAVRNGEPREPGERSVRQGALESSNVTMGEEMVVMMEALRRAESAQRLINVYDDLLGRAIGSFGQA